MNTLTGHIEDQELLDGLKLAYQHLNDEQSSAAATLTLAALLRFSEVDTDKPVLDLENSVKEAVVRTGAYYFGPLFVLSKGTSIPSTHLLKEFQSKGFFIPALAKLSNAKLNLFFITMKGLGLVSDKSLIGYIRYGV